VQDRLHRLAAPPALSGPDAWPARHGLLFAEHPRVAADEVELRRREVGHPPCLVPGGSPLASGGGSARDGLRARTSGRGLVGLLGLLLAVAGCGAEPSRRPAAPAGVAPIGTSPGHRPGALTAAVRAARPVGGLACRPGRRHALTAHLELFARGQVLIVPSGIGIAPPRVEDGAYVRGGRCRYPLWTVEPTGLIDMAEEGLTLGDLFAVWGRRLDRGRLASFALPVRAWVGGRPWRGDPRAIPLTRHAQVVLQAGGPLVEPHAAYRFPAGR
jgi:hypothetical protein